MLHMGNFLESFKAIKIYHKHHVIIWSRAPGGKSAPETSFDLHLHLLIVSF